MLVGCFCAVLGCSWALRNAQDAFVECFYGCEWMTGWVAGWGWLLVGWLCGVLGCSSTLLGCSMCCARGVLMWCFGVLVNAFEVLEKCRGVLVGCFCGVLRCSWVLQIGFEVLRYWRSVMCSWDAFVLFWGALGRFGMLKMHS